MTPAEKEQFVRDLFDNFPECAMCLRCTKWDYQKFLFQFYDEEENLTHTVTLTKALEAFDKLCEQIDAGKFPGFGLPADYKTDPGLWDACPTDALAQMAIFGEVPYG